MFFWYISVRIPYFYHCRTAPCGSENSLQLSVAACTVNSEKLSILWSHLFILRFLFYVSCLNCQASASLLVFPELPIFGSLLCAAFILCNVFCNMWLGILVVSYSKPSFKFCHLLPSKYAHVIILCYLLIYLPRYLFLSFKLLPSHSLCSWFSFLLKNLTLAAINLPESAFVHVHVHVFTPHVGMNYVVIDIYHFQSIPK